MEMISVSPVLHEAWKGRPFSCGHWERGGSYTAEIEDGPIAHFGFRALPYLGHAFSTGGSKKTGCWFQIFCIFTRIPREMI